MIKLERSERKTTINDWMRDGFRVHIYKNEPCGNDIIRDIDKYWSLINIYTSNSPCYLEVHTCVDSKTVIRLFDIVSNYVRFNFAASNARLSMLCKLETTGFDM